MAKKGYAGIAALLCAPILMSAAGCGATTCTLLGEAKEAVNLSRQEETEPLYDFIAKAEMFNARFASAAYDGETDKNIAIAPVSVFMALSLATECAAGNTRTELLSALGMSYEELKENFPLFYRSVAYEARSDLGKITSLVVPANSIWIDSRPVTKAECVQSLAENYYCSSYSADFAENNKSANQAVRDYVKKQTRGLIDRNFELSQDTFFTLINALYLKDVWNEFGDDLRFTNELYPFTQTGGEVKNTRLLEGYYFNGRVCEEEDYTTFYTQTRHGFSIRFLLPKAGKTAGELFTELNLARESARKEYHEFDEENKLHYNTRCLFPEFSAAYDKDVQPALEQMRIRELFQETVCDFSNLTDESVYVEGVRHVTELKVNRKGVEGAAVTVIPSAGSAAPDDRYTEVYEDFVVNGAFVYEICNQYGTTLFSGVVNNI